MKLSRDSAVWLVVIVGGAAGFVTSHWQKFPWIPADYQGVVEMISALAAAVGLKLSTSPLGLSPEGQVKQQIQDLGTPGPSQPPVLPPAA